MGRLTPLHHKPILHTCVRAGRPNANPKEVLYYSRDHRVLMISKFSIFTLGGKEVNNMTSSNCLAFGLVAVWLATAIFAGVALAGQGALLAWLLKVGSCLALLIRASWQRQ